MIQSELDPFFRGFVAVGAIMAVIMLFRTRSRGASAYVMALAFLVLSGTSLLALNRAPISVVASGIAITVALLVAEFLLRARNLDSKEPRR